MSDISKVTLPNGSTYNIKDATARAQITSEAATRKAADDSINNSINDLKSNLTGAMHYVGITTTPITDGMSAIYTRIEGLEDTTAIIINDNKYYPQSGDVVIYENKEFVAKVSYNGKAKSVVWNEFGSTGSLKGLAFKDSASGSITPSGTVSTPTFTGIKSTAYCGIDMAKVVNHISFGSAVGEFDSDTGKFKAPSGGNYGGMVTTIQPTINYSNAGNVTTNPTYKTIKQVDNVGTLPTFSATVNNETLSFSFNAGSLPTTENTQVVSGVSTIYERPLYKISPFTIYGIPVKTYIVPVDVTPQGTISQPTFTGNVSNVTVK